MTGLLNAPGIPCRCGTCDRPGVHYAHGQLVARRAPSGATIAEVAAFERAQLRVWWHARRSDAWRDLGLERVTTPAELGEQLGARAALGYLPVKVAWRQVFETVSRAATAHIRAVLRAVPDDYTRAS